MTQLRLLEDALRDRDWMRVMDVVEALGGEPDQRKPGSAAARESRELASDASRITGTAR